MDIDEPKFKFSNVVWLVGGGTALLIVMIASALSSVPVTPTQATQTAQTTEIETESPQPDFNAVHPDLDMALDEGYGLLSATVQARADELMVQARESGNVRLYLASKLLENKTQLSHAQTKLGVLSGSADDIQIARDRVGDIVALLRCFEMLQQGAAPMSQGVQPNTLLLYLDQFESDLVREFPNLANGRTIAPTPQMPINARELARGNDDNE